MESKWTPKGSSLHWLDSCLAIDCPQANSPFHFTNQTWFECRPKITKPTLLDFISPGTPCGDNDLRSEIKYPPVKDPTECPSRRLLAFSHQVLSVVIQDVGRTFGNSASAECIGIVSDWYVRWWKWDLKELNRWILRLLKGRHFVTY